jgi:hypothetical protein
LNEINNNLSAEQIFTELAAKTACEPETAAPPDKPVIMLKRIGGTTYEVAVHFSKTSRENISGKISRLIKNEAAVRKAANE